MSRSVVIQIRPSTLAATGIQFMLYGNYYLAAAQCLPPSAASGGFDPLPYQLLCQSLELHLKSFVWLVDRSTPTSIKQTYGHDIQKLWRDAKSKGLSRYCRPTPLRDACLAAVGPYYKRRQFTYLDLSMSFFGIPALRKHPKAYTVITRLCKRLSTSLRTPILHVSQEAPAA